MAYYNDPRMRQRQQNSNFAVAGYSPFQKNRSYMDYLQKIANRIAAEQILNEQEQAAQVPAQEFDMREYQQAPEMPYMSGLSPMARYRDMGLRQMGRQIPVQRTPAQALAEQSLREDAAMGVTRQPDGSVTTQGGGAITAPTGYPAQQTLTSPYGTGSSTRVPTGGRGTFSFTAADGSTVTAPFSALKDPKFMKYMREEEVGRGVRQTQPTGRNTSFEDVMAQIESIK